MTTQDDGGAAFRGRGGDTMATKRIGKRGGQFECLLPLPGQVPGEAARSVEGWVLFVSGLPKETLEGDLMDIFAPIGPVRNIRMNTSHKDSKCSGYAMIEFSTAEECIQAVKARHLQPFLSSPCISVTEAFVVETLEAKKEEGDEEDTKRRRED